MEPNPGSSGKAGGVRKTFKTKKKYFWALFQM